MRSTPPSSPTEISTAIRKLITLCSSNPLGRWFLCTNQCQWLPPHLDHPTVFIATFFCFVILPNYVVQQNQTSLHLGYIEGGHHTS